VRKGGDVVGELCATEDVRPDRAVALAETEAIGVPFEEIVGILLNQPHLISILIDVLCRALKEAYAQVNSLAVDDTVQRLVKVLIGLATKIGRRSGHLVEIPTYLTQEEIGQMAAARREPQRYGAVFDPRTHDARCRCSRGPFDLSTKAGAGDPPCNGTPFECYKSNTAFSIERPVWSITNK
jgi:hypothetical protein